MIIRHWFGSAYDLLRNIREGVESKFRGTPRVSKRETTHRQPLQSVRFVPSRGPRRRL